MIGKLKFILLSGIFCCSLSAQSQKSVPISVEGRTWNFGGEFYIYYSPTDPQMALRPSAIENVQYNVITWQSDDTAKLVKKSERLNEQTGDGFDNSILEGDVHNRTADFFALNTKMLVKPVAVTKSGDEYKFKYPSDKQFELEASIKMNSGYGFPLLVYNFTPKEAGYYSIVYAGAPKFEANSVTEIWQPMIWQEKRFPDMSYVTAAFQCPIPTVLVNTSDFTLGVVAHPDEYPFDPLPLLANSRFAVALRTADGKASPMLMAPLFGGAESKMIAGHKFSFRSLIYIDKKDITSSYENIARNIYGFTDYRRNDISTLNNTLDNIIDYSLSSYSWFIDDQKGCGYSTDVPDAVKNVSSLNPLEISFVTDNRQMFDKRAYPILEYQLSREKFLFSADSTQKIQSPSRNMDGPIAPVSELASLYSALGNNMPFLTELAEKEYNRDWRIRNLDVKERGNTWQNAMWMYKATKDEKWLRKAIDGADNYLKERVYKKAQKFDDPDGGGYFFWTGYTPKWIDLVELYEITNDSKYLEAAHEGARRYTMFTWMSPQIPNDSILANIGGKAPLYWYLAQKGHKQMHIAEEKAPAWRLSEMGLTPESSGTCSGHRAIFMVNYSPWMLRIAHYTDDNFLRDVAKAAIIGRYRNFPGYHINTARTTIYEKEDYPLRSHKWLSVNSFHYNHIMPQASFILDYLITDIWDRSDKNISFPDQFIEGYAYLQSKMYGFREGDFYGEKAILWMPKHLLKSSSTELNHISARNDRKLMIAFSNQSNQHVHSAIELNTLKVYFIPGKEYNVRVIGDNQEQPKTTMVDGKFDIDVSPNGITAVIIEGVEPYVDIQDQLLTRNNAWENGYYESGNGVVRAMLLNIGSLEKNVYIYSTWDDTRLSSVTINYGSEAVTDNMYPFEFTIPLGDSDTSFEARVTAKDLKGNDVDLGTIVLSE